MKLWIESHTVLLRHRKNIELARELRLRPVYTMGHLHALWHAALEQQEDGDLSSWSDDLIAEQSSFPGDAATYVRLLQKHGWLDGKLIHDWLDRAGLYLTRKYSTSDRERLVRIWKLHGREYGGGANGQRAISELEANLPNPTSPDLTKKPMAPNEASGGRRAKAVALASDDPSLWEVPGELDTPAFRQSWGDFIRHRQASPDRKNWLTPLAAQKTLKQLVPFGIDGAIGQLDRCLANNWRGVVFSGDLEKHRKAKGVIASKAPPALRARIDADQQARQREILRNKQHDADVTAIVDGLDSKARDRLVDEFSKLNPRAHRPNIATNAHLREFIYERCKPKAVPA